MPIKIPNSLPARAVLDDENIFVMTETRALHQDIRPLRIIILNLMPIKVTTETQLLRSLSNTPLQIEIDLLQTSTHISKNTPEDHLLKFYNVFDDIKDKRYDGMIVTGAPVETMEFEEVDYWDELCTIFEWTKANVHSTLHICWGAQAALYYHYGIPKHDIAKKMFGIYQHKVLNRSSRLLRGFDDVFYAPHSRHSELRQKDLRKVSQVKVLATSDEAGVYLAAANRGRQIFVIGHPEYDAETLSNEYFRDLSRGIQIDPPVNYFRDNDPEKGPLVTWRSHANLLYTNWLNYYVYQTTPYNLSELK